MLRQRPASLARSGADLVQLSLVSLLPDYKDTMSETPITTQPPSRRDELIQERYLEEIAKQSERMDALARQLVTLALAIPGLYATLLKLVAGDKAVVASGWALYSAFGCWLLALVLSLVSLIPRRYRVEPRRLEGMDEACAGEQPLSILAFFRCSARYKRRLLLPSALLLFAGVFILSVEIL